VSTLAPTLAPPRSRTAARLAPVTVVLYLAMAVLGLPVLAVGALLPDECRPGDGEV
jgi:hypothetical protein